MAQESLIIKGTGRTPSINFNSSNGQFEISGASIPEDTLAFYKEVFNWIDVYAESPVFNTVLKVNLDYFNTSSSKCLYTVFKKLEAILKGPGKVEVLWYYDLKDTDMFESGNDFMQLVKLPFKVLRKEGSKP